MIRTHALRLNPGNDLKIEVQSYVIKHNIQAGWVACCVGSLTQFSLRFANQASGHAQPGYFEITGISGTVSVHGSHLHISISDREGNTKGGHLLQGNIIFTTAEIIILETDEFLFTREKDGTTEWKELQIRKKE